MEEALSRVVDNMGEQSEQREQLTLREKAYGKKLTAYRKLEVKNAKEKIRMITWPKIVANDEGG